MPDSSSPQLQDAKHSRYRFRREWKTEKGERFWRQFIVCATCGKESPDTTYPECFK
jgi:hypothetical protein